MDARDHALWQHLIKCNEASLDATETFLRDARDPVSVVRCGLRGNVVETLTAIGLLSRMDVLDRTKVFDELVVLCLSQKFGQAARQAVLRLPRDWVVANIEKVFKPLLQTFDHLDYLMLLGLYKSLSHDLATKLAREAAQSDDYEAKEIGEEFLRNAGD